MSKNSKNTKTSVAEIIQLFKTSPDQAYQLLVSSGHYFHTKQAKVFWEAYPQEDHENLIEQFPESIGTLNRVVWLKVFYDLSMLIEKEKVNRINSIISLNPDETSLTKALFLCLDIGETNIHPSFYSGYSEDSLEAAKTILCEILPLLKNENKTHYSFTLAKYVSELIKIQIDIALLLDFLDAFVWGGFEMTQKEDLKGFILGLPTDNTKEQNLFILNHLKTAIKRDFKRKESHPKISGEDHFKKIDPVWKTNKGLATVFVSEGVTITSQDEGTTFLNLDDVSFEDIRSDDPAVRDDRTLKMLLIMLNQSFHLHYRNALAQVYEPTDEIDIHAVKLEIKTNVFVNLYELICAMSCLIARSDAFRYISELSYCYGVKKIKRDFHCLYHTQKPELTSEERENLINSEIISHFNMIEEKFGDKLFPFFEEDDILGWFSKIEELKIKPQNELKAMLELFSKIDSILPFNPIYKIDGKYYFSYETCIKTNLNRFVYDYYISDKLFNSRRKSKTEVVRIDVNQKEREKKFNNSLKELFKKITPFSAASIKFDSKNKKYDFGGLDGDFDMIAYFKKENIIVPIQVKLSNVSPRTEKRKAEWIANHITGKAIRQVKKDVDLLKTPSGLKFIANKLGLKTRIKAPVIYPLIVTDNFFADHSSFPYNENGDQVLCLSYFELESILLNQKVHEKQPDWELTRDGKVAANLIQIIEENLFWQFLQPFAADFKFSKSTSGFNEPDRIEMKI